MSLIGLRGPARVSLSPLLDKIIYEVLPIDDRVLTSLATGLSAGCTICAGNVPNVNMCAAGGPCDSDRPKLPLGASLSYSIFATISALIFLTRYFSIVTGKNPRVFVNNPDAVISAAAIASAYTTVRMLPDSAFTSIISTATYMAQCPRSPNPNEGNFQRILCYGMQQPASNLRGMRGMQYMGNAARVVFDKTPIIRTLSDKRRPVLAIIGVESKYLQGTTFDVTLPMPARDAVLANMVVIIVGWGNYNAALPFKKYFKCVNIDGVVRNFTKVFTIEEYYPINTAYAMV